MFPTLWCEARDLKSRTPPGIVDTAMHSDTGVSKTELYEQLEKLRKENASLRRHLELSRASADPARSGRSQQDPAEALAQSRLVLRRIGRIARVGAWEMSIDQSHHEWTEQIFRIHDLVPGQDPQPTAEEALQYYPPEAREKLITETEKAIDQQDSFDLELPLVTASGRKIWVRTQGEVIYDGEDPVSLHGTMQDITARREAEEELARQEELLRSINAHLSEGVYRSRPASGLEYVNQAFVRMFGYDSKEDLFASESAALYADDDARRELLERERKEDQLSGMEVKLRRKDGSTFWALVSSTVVRGDDGSIEYFDGAVVDITPRKKAEQALEKSRAQLAAIIGTAMDAILTIDEHDGILVFNRAAEELFGYNRDEIKGRPLSRILPQASGLTLQKFVDNLIAAEGRAPGTPHVRRLHARHADGSEFPVEVSISPVDAEESSLYSVILRDITERERFEQQLIEAKAHAERMNQLKSSFLANMSHEVRTPLTSIIGFADVLHRQVDADAAELVKLIRSSGQRLMETLNSVLDLAQIESESVQLEFRRIDLSETVQQTVPLFRAHAEQKGLYLESQPAEDPIWVHGDRSAIDRIVANLLSNAIKFTREGGVRLRIDSDGDAAHLHVQDTGIGIPEDAQDRVFDEFEQVSAGLSREFEGTGLGLTISKQLVAMMNGEIEVDSTPGEGSTFTVSLPKVP